MMSSACLVVKPSHAGAAPSWSRPPIANRSPGTSASARPLWRPWLCSSSDSLVDQRSRQTCPYSSSRLAALPGRLSSSDGGKPQSFQHPVRLFWPKSKSFDYLYSDGEALLRNFPVQATISFYEDSDSEEDEDDYDEEAEEEEEEEEEECAKQSSRSTDANNTLN